MPKSNAITEYIKTLETLRQKNSEKMHQAALRWNELANNRSSEISKLLFSIASLVLPISFVPLTQEGFTLDGSPAAKFFLIFSWLLFVVSLVCGFLYLKREAKFFNKWANQENERSKIYSESILTTDAQEAYDRFERMNQDSSAEAEMPNTTDPFFLNLQQIFLVAGILFIGISLSFKLFSNSQDQQLLCLHPRNQECPFGISKRNRPLRLHYFYSR